MDMMSINDRINPRGKNPHNPVLRWQSGRAVETLRLESGLVPADDGYDNEIDYSDPFAVWGDSGEADMLDSPLSDREWADELAAIGIN